MYTYTPSLPIRTPITSPAPHLNGVRLMDSSCHTENVTPCPSLLLRQLSHDTL